jgi:integrase
MTLWPRSGSAIDNPIRRDLQLFILTGLRATDAKTVRWDHVDFVAGTIHRPMPKGGEDRAFTVPVPNPHRLRDTFASAAHEAGVDWYDLEVLMNHALPSSGDVTMGFVRVSVDYLREAAEKIAGFLLAKLG